MPASRLLDFPGLVVAGLRRGVSVLILGGQAGSWQCAADREP